MDPSFWQSRWQEGRIGFHEGRANAYLQKHGARLGERRRVLVPLCGKAEDMAFLAANGHDVVGIDVAREAAVSFFREHEATPAVSKRGAFEVFTAGAISILVGDFFSATRDDVGDVNAYYDRAALVALPKDARIRYVERIRALVPRESAAMVITFTYPQEKMAGPPFSVSEDEIRELYRGSNIELVDQGPATGGRLSALGLEAQEQCYAIAL